MTAKTRSKRTHGVMKDVSGAVGTGYDTDGTSFWLAPILHDEIMEIQDEIGAANGMLEQANMAAQKVFTRLIKRRRAWWDKVLEGLSIPRDARAKYRYNYLDRSISPIEAEDEDDTHDVI